MCKVSEKIKFCTCGDIQNIEELDDYWILHRFNKDKDEDDIMIGMLAPPTVFRDSNFEFNENAILERLNTGEAFDKPMNLEKRDRLEVVINMNDDDGSFSYNFQFYGRKWKAVKEDVLGLLERYDQNKRGKVEAGLESFREEAGIVDQ
ncbi:MAG TPA: hypothetical protein DCR04_06880 [Flavobacteriales bacterium]|nr:hypothetical protein [Flavobacteriales bacterium]